MRKHTWVTDYGCVDVSDLKARVIRADCERVAKWNLEHA